ncbi:hypothetical protein P7C71_g5258, partial [Lecanoromycetidae sp. Uapishka_2]
MNSSNTSAIESKPPIPQAPGLSNDQISRFVQPRDSNAPTSSRSRPCSVKPVTFKVHDDRSGPLRAFLHVPRDYHRDMAEEQANAAAVLLAGADGGVLGPSSIYLSLADRVASLQKGILTMRLDYRYPANQKYCIKDVLAAMAYLENKYAISCFVLVGWSFGGSLVATVGGSDKRVVGCAMLASQLAETDGIKTMAPRPLLLMHGTGDRTMRSSCSEELSEDYGEAGDKELKLFEGDDHNLTDSSREAVEMLCDFVMKCAGAKTGAARSKLVQKGFVGDRGRLYLRENGVDLEEAEDMK